MISRARNGFHLLSLVAGIQSARNCHCKVCPLVICGVWLLFLAACYSSVMSFAGEVCSPLSTGSGVGCMGSYSGIFPFWGMSLQNNWNIMFSIFQFHVVHTPIPVPHRSVLPVACPFALFLFSALKYPLFLSLILTFHLFCPTSLFLTACVLLNFHHLFKVGQWGTSCSLSCVLS